MLIIYGMLVAAGAVILFQTANKRVRLQKPERKCFHILWGFCVLAFVMRGSAVAAERNSQRTEIERNACEEGSKEVRLTAFHGEDAQEIRLTVEPRSYTKQETEALYKQFIPELEHCLLGENSSLDEVRSPLVLAENIKGFPFSVEWECDAEGTVRLDGTLANETLDEQGKVVNIRAKISYESGVGDGYGSEESMNIFLREYEFAVCVLPPVYTDKEKFRMNLEEEVKKAEADKRSIQTFGLPERINGVPVTWKEAVEDKSPVCILLGIVTAVLFWKSGEEKQKKIQEEREKALKNAYPEFAARMALFLSAGMTVRAAFGRIAEASGTGVLREEMQKTCHEMDSGIPESQAYTHFGQRCRLKQYRKFSALLTQNLKKGSRGILAQLEKEAHEALEEKKSNARQLGEEAGTKLLVPMAGMLAVTMLLIIVPAYGSFGL